MSLKVILALEFMKVIVTVTDRITDAHSTIEGIFFWYMRCFPVRNSSSDPVIFMPLKEVH